MISGWHWCEDQLVFQLSRFAYAHWKGLHGEFEHGCPRFSGVDLESGKTFVPGFFQSCPKMPHGLLVLSNDSATGMLFGKRSVPIDRFIRVNQPVVDQWSAKYELA